MNKNVRVILSALALGAVSLGPTVQAAGAVQTSTPDLYIWTDVPLEPTTPKTVKVCYHAPAIGYAEPHQDIIVTFTNHASGEVKLVALRTNEFGNAIGEEWAVPDGRWTVAAYAVGAKRPFDTERMVSDCTWP